MAHFLENPSERSARGPWSRTKCSVRFRLAGLSLPMWPCTFGYFGLQVAASTSALLASYSVTSSFFRSLSSTASISSSPVCFPAPNPRLLNFRRSLSRTVLLESLKKVYFVRRKQRVKGRVKKEMKDAITGHQRKGSLPSPLSSSHSPFAFYSTSGKTLLLLPRRLSVPPRTALQGKPR